MHEGKRLSIPRLFLGLLILGAISYGAFLGWNKIKAEKPTIQSNPWFAPYVDITATPSFSFEQTDNASINKNIVLSFIVSDSTNPCTPSWGNAYTINDANSKLDLDRRIARFRQLGGNIAISFGGQLNDELAINCTKESDLYNAYKSVIAHYSVDTIDLDIEGSNLQNKDAMKRRADTIAKLQKDMKNQNKSLAVWLTLPVAPNGLTEDGTDAITTMLNSGVDLAGVNVMTMDYGTLPANGSLQEANTDALNNTHRQLGILYDNAGIHLNSASIWGKIGATPMIGQNDTEDEVFTLDDAKVLNTFIEQNQIARLSMWSANRDIECGENYVNTQIVSDSCSGVKEDKFAFSNLLQAGLSGKISDSAAKTTVADQKDIETPDDPATSPYQIWSADATYLEGTKIVWHHNVYVAKWWTQGDLPDNPVLQSFQTPWQLVGPVLPGETPIPVPTVAPGTYPQWSGTAIYEAGSKVILNGVPYQAKWWTQGDSPAASRENPDSSPWVAINP
ncbi:MAG TPA: carbohydrate-binding protein [Patescibacteria group bacterium]|nr:carbohydrate-binding protein [Patescibacteria group bacterium]